MPYTPPTQHSPIASQSSTPRPSISISTTSSSAYHKDSTLAVPSSTAYIHRHRRSPSIVSANADLTDESVRNTITNASTMLLPAASIDGNLSESRLQIRARSLENIEKLQAAIRVIEQHRASSPSDSPEERVQTSNLLALGRSHVSNTRALAASIPTPPLSASARKISHSRSSTEGCTFLDRDSRSGSEDGGSPFYDDDEDEDLTIKPALIRKKSGELVRPALRPAAYKRASSVPGTPTYSKAVHFQENSMEHVRHFLQLDRPIAVSAGSSPVDSHDDEMEFPFGGRRTSKASSYNWEIRLPNFPQAIGSRGSWPVRTEQVYLSPDTRTLIGNVVVRNMAFHKFVVVRYTLDYWRTTSEVVAEYNPNPRGHGLPAGHDRFTFTVKLDDQANLENKTMFFCVRYTVDGQEYWDNNNNINYEVDFSKQRKTANNQTSPKHRSVSTSSVTSRNRPRSMPSFDDFSNHMVPFGTSSYPQDSPIRFRNRPVSEVLADPPVEPQPKITTGQHAFGTRYDFGASLSAAIQAAGTSAPKAAFAPGNQSPLQVPEPTVMKSVDNKPAAAEKQVPTAEATSSTTDNTLASIPYDEILHKYCFFGSAKPSPVAFRPSQLAQSSPFTSPSTAATKVSPIALKLVSNAATSPTKSIIASTDGPSDEAEELSPHTKSGTKPTTQPTTSTPLTSPPRNSIARSNSAASRRPQTRSESPARPQAHSQPPTPGFHFTSYLNLSRSPSPAHGQSAMPTGPFGYPYHQHQGMGTGGVGFFDGAAGPSNGTVRTAIRG